MCCIIHKDVIVMSVMTDHIHKQFPLDDEELSCRHSAETLVGRDEEEGTHPARGTAKQKQVVTSVITACLRLLTLACPFVLVWLFWLPPCRRNHYLKWSLCPINMLYLICLINTNTLGFYRGMCCTVSWSGAGNWNVKVLQIALKKQKQKYLKIKTLDSLHVPQNCT